MAKVIVACHLRKCVKRALQMGPQRDGFLNISFSMLFTAILNVEIYYVQHTCSITYLYLKNKDKSPAFTVSGR